VSPRPNETASGRPRPQGRTPAEWTLFGVCLAVVMALVAVIVWLWATGESRQPHFAVTVGSVEPAGPARTRFPVDVRNTGTITAADVHVVARDPAGQVLVGQTLDFVSGGETVSLTFVLSRAPGEVAFDVASFRTP
jgi:uncharacterized protein (TIGR02588 family)